MGILVFNKHFIAATADIKNIFYRGLNNNELLSAVSTPRWSEIISRECTTEIRGTVY